MSTGILTASDLAREIEAEERDQLVMEIARQQAVGRAAQQLAAIQQTLQRRRWVDPAVWVRERLREELWSTQVRIMRAVRDHRKVAVASCHEIGKSFICGRIVGHWLDSHRPGEAVAVTTAPTGRQVKAILWKEIGRAQAKGLPGRTNQTEWYMQTEAPGLPTGVKEEMVAFGFKPADYDPTAFQGIHALYPLVVIDEGCGIPKTIIEAADSLIANDNGRLVMIGNPDDPETEFYKACLPGSGWHVIWVGAFDTPTFTGEPVSEFLRQNLIGRIYVESKRKAWAPKWGWVNADGSPATPETGVRVVPPAGADSQDTHPYWQSKVLGKFPKQGEAGGLFTMDMIRQAQARELPEEGEDVLGVDVGGGGDSSDIAHRKGGRVRIVHEDHNPSTMVTTGNVLSWLRRTGASHANVDKIGIGQGVVDRAVEQGEPVFGVNVADAAPCNCSAKGNPDRKKRKVHQDGRNPEKFTCNRLLYENLKAYLWFAVVRQAFETGTIDLDDQDEDLAAELLTIRYFRTSSGTIQIESKDAVKRRGGKSYNRAEALMLTYAEPGVADAQPLGGLLF